MKHFKLIFLILAVFCNGLLITSADAITRPDKFTRSRNAIPNRYIVTLNEDKNDLSGTSTQVDSLSNDLTRTYGGSINMIYTAALKGFSVEMSEKEAIALSRDARVKNVQEDVLMFSTAIQEAAVWGLDRVDQRDLPVQGDYSFTSMGTGVNAYVIDSGIRRTHTDFGGRVQYGFDAVGDGQNGNDCYGHGTHVAGTVGSSTYGVAKNVTLYPVRVLQCDGFGMGSAVLAGIDWVTANHIQPAVANLSITANGPWSTLDDAITAAVASGVTFVVSASNNSADACNYSPARTPDAITVGASNWADQRAPISNFGPCVDIFAPGAGITSTGYASDTATAVMSGTSMASPHVAGAAALYLETHRSASPAEVGAAISANASQSVLANVGAGSPNLLLYTLAAAGTEPIRNVDPNSGSAYIGNYKTISWTNAIGFNSNVTIELSKDGGATFPITIAANVPNTGSYMWMVPVEQTNSARIRVREFDLPAPSGASSGNFIINFAPSAASVLVSGAVTDANGSPIANVTVTLTNSSGQMQRAITSPFGVYSFDSVDAGETYIVAPTHKRFQFVPMVINVADELTDVNFMAME